MILAFFSFSDDTTLTDQDILRTSIILVWHLLVLNLRKSLWRIRKRNYSFSVTKLPGQTEIENQNDYRAYLYEINSTVKCVLFLFRYETYRYPIFQDEEVEKNRFWSAWSLGHSTNRLKHSIWWLNQVIFLQKQSSQNFHCQVILQITRPPYSDKHDNSVKCPSSCPSFPRRLRCSSYLVRNFRNSRPDLLSLTWRHDTDMDSSCSRWCLIFHRH